MVFTPRIRDAIGFAVQTHEVEQKQKRKGKDVPYVTHPLTVGLILARAKAGQDVIIAGILHDTIEDSLDENKVTFETLVERFGKNVADIVMDLTEQNRDLPWEERKREAIRKIRTFSKNALLVKSADLISNVSEILEDYKNDGERVFHRFNAPADKVIRHCREAMETVLGVWKDNPFSEDLKNLIAGLEGFPKKQNGSKQMP